MKSSVVLSLASVALAAPAVDIIEKRQFTMTVNDLTKGSCKDVTFIWVRGTTELGNLGEFVGGRLYPELKKVFPSLAVEGVAYGAGVPGNLMPGGGDPAGIKEATKDYKLAASKCPDTIITGGGYSQGAAITHRTVEALPAEVKARIAGITLYGDTQFYQDKGRIKNFPPEKVKTYCNGYQELKSYSADGVCNGLLNVNYGHMSYGDSMKPGATWLKGKVDAFKASDDKSSTKKPAPKAESPKPKGDKPAPKKPPTKEPPAKEPPAKEPPAKAPPAKAPPAKEPPAKAPPAKEPPAKEPPAKEPPAEEPSAKEPAEAEASETTEETAAAKEPAKDAPKAEASETTEKTTAAKKPAKEATKSKPAKGTASAKIASVFDGAVDAQEAEAEPAPIVPAVDAASVEQLSRTIAQTKAEAAPILAAAPVPKS